MTSMGSRTVIIGGVAGGASTAARLRRLDEGAEIIVLEKSGHVSFANCGLPYHLSGTIAKQESLLLQTPQSLYDRLRLDVRVHQEVIEIDRETKQLVVVDNAEGGTYSLSYDNLVLSPGGRPMVPDVPGATRAVHLHTIEDLEAVKQRLDDATDVVVVGGGFIGLEAAENLVRSDRRVTLLELADQVLAPLDPEMARPVLEELERNGVNVRLRTSVSSIGEEHVVLSDGTEIPAQMVLFALGVRPNTDLARAAGLSLGPNGGIAVSETMKTSDPNIWAVGDAVEKKDLVSGDSALIPLANVANRQGRLAADSIAGRSRPALPSQGTAIVGVFGLAAAMTGWNEKRLRAAGRDYLAIHTHPTDHAGYYPAATGMAIKLLVSPGTGEILGAQIVGRGGVDKRIDVLATAMRTGLTAPELPDLELAYAPQFGSAKDPINQLGYVAENRLSGLQRTVDWSQVGSLIEQGWTVLDVRTPGERRRGSVTGSVNIPVDELRERLGELDPQGHYIVHCAVGQRSHIATQVLTANGFDAVNLDGGYTTLAAGTASQRTTDGAGVREAVIG